MRLYFPLFILIFACTAFSQTSAGQATATYSTNDKLIGLANLTDGLSDCSIRSAAGRVKGFDREGTVVRVTVKLDKKNTTEVIVPLDRLKEDDRKAVFRHLITKNNTLRLSGYGCEAEKPFTAFSVDRVY